jgi:hypothetical protein
MGDGRSSGENVGERYVRCWTGVRDDDGEVVAGAHRRGGDVRAGCSGAGEVAVEAAGCRSSDRTSGSLASTRRRVRVAGTSPKGEGLVTRRVVVAAGPDHDGGRVKP